MKQIETYHSETDAYLRAAKNRVDDLKGFYSNVISYCVIIPVLIFINYKTYWEFKWFWFAALGWGIGVFFHAFHVFGMGSTWQEKQIKKIMEKERNNNLS